ncbi:MAG TPA: tyrosine-type recombinase/integrase, partial [Thermoleophilaceae bacterium]|nr:tyrosine-type recombinase/integrase [Thermoleophilaceae bacterium]
MARRSYGTGHLYARADKRGRVVWYGQWRVGDTKVKRTIGLKRENGSREGLTRAQAERELRRRIEAEAVVRPVAARRTVLEVGEDYVDHLEHVMDRKATTIKDYRGYVHGHFEPFFRDRPIDRIDEGWVAAYLKHKRGKGLSAKTVHNHLNFMHGLFKFAVKRGWAGHNPVALVDRPRKPHRSSTRLQFLQPVELEAVIRAAPDDALGAVERPLYLTAAMTGMRQGELIALPWIDVDWVARRIRVADNFPRGRTDQADTPKSHEGRSVPMADSVAAELERHFQRSRFCGDPDLVFGHPQTGKPLDPSKIRRRFVSALKRAGVGEITFHELRHTFGTQLAAAGVPLRTIQEWMGHADAKTTEIYRHYAPDATHG